MYYVLCTYVCNSAITRSLALSAVTVHTLVVFSLFFCRILWKPCHRTMLLRLNWQETPLTWWIFLTSCLGSVDACSVLRNKDYYCNFIQFLSNLVECLSSIVCAWHGFFHICNWVRAYVHVWHDCLSVYDTPICLMIGNWVAKEIEGQASVVTNVMKWLGLFEAVAWYKLLPSF